MTATNHVLTGAVIALVVKQPVLALPLAFVSHFVLDALPHFGVNGDIMGRNRLLLFRIVWPLDSLLLVGLFIFVLVNSPANMLLILLAMCAAASPDLAWVYRFGLKEKWGKLPPTSMNMFNRLHAKIQWGERQWGIFVELIWFAVMMNIFIQLLS